MSRLPGDAVDPLYAAAREELRALDARIDALGEDEGAAYSDLRHRQRKLAEVCRLLVEVGDFVDELNKG